MSGWSGTTASSAASVHQPLEDRTAHEQPLVRGTEQCIAPVDRAVHGLVAFRACAHRSRRQGQASFEMLGDLFGGEGERLRRGELNRQRQPIEAAADAGYRLKPVTVGGSAPARSPAPLEEQRHRRGLLEGLAAGELVACRYGERRQEVHLLSAHVERRATRRQQAQVRAGTEQTVHERRDSIEQVLTVVEDEQRLPRPKETDRCLRRPRGLALRADCGREGRRNGGGLPDAVEGEPIAFVREARDSLVRELECEARPSRSLRARRWSRDGREKSRGAPGCSRRPGRGQTAGRAEPAARSE